MHIYKLHQTQLTSLFCQQKRCAFTAILSLRTIICNSVDGILVVLQINEQTFQ